MWVSCLDGWLPRTKSALLPSLIWPGSSGASMEVTISRFSFWRGLYCRCFRGAVYWPGRKREEC